MRILLVLAAIVLTGCTNNKYTEAPQPHGVWMPANEHPDLTDNNILPEQGATDVR
jgi:hypothetical protein